MLIPYVVATEADKIFVNILNVQAASVTDGEVVVWDTGTPDGVRATQPATATLGLFIGLVQGTIAAGAYGLAQSYGYKSSAQFSADSDTAINALGAILTPTAATDYLMIAAATGVSAVLAASTPGSGHVYLAEAKAAADTDTLVSAKVFIRAM